MEPENSENKIGVVSDANGAGSDGGAAKEATTAEAGTGSVTEVTEVAEVTADSTTGVVVEEAGVAAETAVNAASNAAQNVAPVSVTPSDVPMANSKTSGEKVNFLQTILEVFVKPVTVVREQLAKYNNPKNAGIVAGIALAVSVILSVISTFFNVIFSFHCTSGVNKTCKASFDMDWLKYWKFGDFLFKNIVSTVVVMLLVAGVFFGVAKLLKSQKANFWRVLSVVSLAMLPMILTGFIGAFVGEFSVNFQMYIAVMGAIYAMVIFYEGVTADAELNKDKKAYYVMLATVLTFVALAVLVWLVGDKIGLTSFLPILEA